MSIVNSTAATAVAPPKLSRRRWGIILILLLAAVVNYLDRANLSIANTTISKEFGFPVPKWVCYYRRFSGPMRWRTYQRAGWSTASVLRRCSPVR